MSSGLVRESTTRGPTLYVPLADSNGPAGSHHPAAVLGALFDVHGTAISPTPRVPATQATDGVPYIYGWYGLRAGVERFIDRSIVDLLVFDAGAVGDGIPSPAADPFRPFCPPGTDWMLLYVGKHEGAGNPIGKRVFNQAGRKPLLRTLGGDTLPTQLSLVFGGGVDARVGDGRALSDRVRNSLRARASERANSPAFSLSWVQVACRQDAAGHQVTPGCCPAHSEAEIVGLGGAVGAPAARPLFNALW